MDAYQSVTGQCHKDGVYDKPFFQKPIGRGICKYRGQEFNNYDEFEKIYLNANSKNKLKTYDQNNKDLIKLKITGECEDCDLRGVDLSGFHFRENANINRSNFSGSNLSGADLSNVKFWRNNFKNADLSNANLSGTGSCESNFEGADFSYSDLRYTSFNGSNFKNADFDHANLSHARGFGSTCTHDWQHHPYKAPVTDLSGANFKNANFKNANLRNNDFSGLNFSGANFTRADFYQADFGNSDLSEAILNNVRSLGNARFCNTETPWGTDNSDC